MSEKKNELSHFDNKDDRYFPRWKVRNRVHCRIEKDAEPQDGFTEDLSCAGACITIDKKFLPTQLVNLSIQFSNSVSIKVKGKVVWTKGLNKNNQIGVNFVDVSQKAQDLILEHAFDFNRDSMVKHWFKDWKKKK